MTDVGITKACLIGSQVLILLGYCIGLVMLVQDGIQTSYKGLWILFVMTGLLTIPILLSIILVYEKMRD